ncbi:MAG: hypothetical protein DCC49_10390 [Acidobacteria bacterium]|nr:MAG: hypothetical protein DCC49_10390 [Acidobacteriota bacterium]
MSPDFVIRATPGRIACEVEVFDHQCRCVVLGNLDAYTARQFEALLSELPAEIDRVTIDLTAVKWPDASSLGVIEAFMRAVRQRGGAVQLAGTYGQLRRMSALGVGIEAQAAAG